MKKAVLAVALASTFVAPAFAESSINPLKDEKSGFYLGLGLGSADYNDAYDNLKDEYDGFMSGTTSYTTRDMAWKVFGGYRVNKYFALEANYTSLGNPDADFTNTSGTYRDEIENEIKGYGIKAVGLYPINNNFEVLASVGTFKWKVEEDEENNRFGPSSETEKGTSLTYGLGANYYLTDNISVGLNWERINDVGDKDNLFFGENDIDTYTISAQYNF
ncbi:outer membrane beta-barrel protein [Zooshikella harenae]|uniref:Porin family protein n=1 Tax=Zooshikella harenae TaxID=2827238 RepID=A0ABS5ZF63_9GAMM|nr:outer membrane beta-barrel protein [Zooshikella harenae]MBU2712625.1 porin family protein [Zooshikella harenae]